MKDDLDSNAFDISVTPETSQYGITPYPEEIAYSVHSPVVGDSLRQAVMALEKVASVIGARHSLGFALMPHEEEAYFAKKAVAP